MLPCYIPCLFNNPENNTYDLNQMGIDVPDEDFIVRDVYFFVIDNISPRVFDDMTINGSVISSGGSSYYSLLKVEEIVEKIGKNIL